MSVFPASAMCSMEYNTPTVILTSTIAMTVIPCIRFCSMSMAEDSSGETNDPEIRAEQTAEGLHVVFDHADGGGEDVNDSVITVRSESGTVERRFVLWSPYFLTDRPAKMAYTAALPPLGPGKYRVTVMARGFWYNESEDRLEASTRC